MMALQQRIALRNAGNISTPPTCTSTSPTVVMRP